MNNTFNPDLPVQTRDGRPAHIICTNRKGKYPIVAIVGTDEDVIVFTNEGRIFETSENSNDLINIKTDHDRRVEVAEIGVEAELGPNPKIYTSYGECLRSAIHALEHINWPACAEQP